LIHELIHILTLGAGGVPAHLAEAFTAAPVGYPWTFDGLTGAVVFYAAQPATIVVAALAGPSLTLVSSYVSLFLYRSTRSPWLWAATVNPLILRIVTSTIAIPSYLSGRISTFDEAIAAHFAGVPLSTFVWPSLALGYGCIACLLAFTPKRQRLRYLISTLIGGAGGYFLVSFILDRFVLT
jgi:hypothetical protein